MAFVPGPTASRASGGTGAFCPGWRHQPGQKGGILSRLMAPTGTKGPRSLLSRLVAPTGTREYHFIPVKISNRDKLHHHARVHIHLFYLTRIPLSPTLSLRLPRLEASRPSPSSSFLPPIPPLQARGGYARGRPGEPPGAQAAVAGQAPLPSAWARRSPWLARRRHPPSGAQAGMAWPGAAALSQARSQVEPAMARPAAAAESPARGRSWARAACLGRPAAAARLGLGGREDRPVRSGSRR